MLIIENVFLSVYGFLSLASSIDELQAISAETSVPLETLEGVKKHVRVPSIVTGTAEEVSTNKVAV